jgi:hypothetical protein
MSGQDKNVRFGKVTQEEVSMKSYEKDPQAEALFIYDKRELAFLSTFTYQYNVYARIKIFNKNALNLADVKIPFITENSRKTVTGIAANTYNMVDEKMVKTTMTKQNIFTEKVADGLSVTKFSLPGEPSFSARRVS